MNKLKQLIYLVNHRKFQFIVGTIFIIIFLSQLGNALTDDSIYIISGNSLIKNNDYKIIFETNLESDLLIDDINIYSYSNKDFYIINKTNGNIKYKIHVNNISQQKQTDKYVYLKTINYVYKINKSTGTIEDKFILNQDIEKIYTLFFPEENIGFIPIVNNTNLYPNERTNNTIYYANDTSINLYIIFHALGNGASQTFDSNLSINGTIVLDKDFKTSSGSGFHDHWSFFTTIPKGSNYSITNSSNVFNIEWKEYPILTGRNNTLSLNQTFINITNSYNQTYDTNITKLQVNDSYFNSSIFPQSTNFRNDGINDTIIRNYTVHTKTGTFTRDISLASGTQSITGIGFKPESISFKSIINGNVFYSDGYDTITDKTVIFKDSPITNPNTLQFATSRSIIIRTTGTPDQYLGNVQSFDNDGFTITWTKQNSPTGTATIIYKASR